MPSNSICYLFECSLHANSLWIFVSKSIETLQHRIITNHSIQNLILNPDLDFKKLYDITELDVRRVFFPIVRII